MRETQECGFPEKLVGLVNVDYHLMTVVGEPAYLHLSVDDEIDIRGRLILAIDHLSLFVLNDAGARQMS
jgi:hypothetical protein